PSPASVVPHSSPRRLTPPRPRARTAPVQYLCSAMLPLLDADRAMPAGMTGRWQPSTTFARFIPALAEFPRLRPHLQTEEALGVPGENHLFLLLGEWQFGDLRRGVEDVVAVDGTRAVGAEQHPLDADLAKDTHRLIRRHVAVAARGMAVVHQPAGHV